MESALVEPADHRSEGRSNVFLTAALKSGAATIAVRIRNLSQHGALIEASSLPPVGAQVRLSRGQLEVSGELAWQSAGQSGINFAGNIDVQQWVRHVGHGGQQRIDGAIAALRGSAQIPPEQAEEERLESIAAISGALDRVCEDLAAIPNMSIDLGECLIKLDSIAQALRSLATGQSY